MKPMMTKFVVAIGMASALLIVGVSIVVAWQTLIASIPPRQANVVAQNFDAPPLAQNDVFEFPNGIPIQDEILVAPEELPKAGNAVIAAKNCTVSGPHVHNNLAVYLIHGKDIMKRQDIMTLEEALAQNLAVVHETGTGQLTIDNRGKLPLFIQSGDIVKGGTQDRTLPSDLLVAPQTNGNPVVALCVEKGRSFPRGNEISTSFQTATEQLPGKQLKLAAYRQAQIEVWNNVQALQVNLTRNVGAPVQSAQSQTSLQLTLESNGVRNAIGETLDKLAPLMEMDGKQDVIGYVVVVNGKIQTADVYASAAMFQKLLPKLMKASAVDALAQFQKDTDYDVPNVQTVEKFLFDAEQGQGFRRTVSARTVVIRHDSATALLYDTCDPTQQNLVLHRSFLTK